MLSDPDSRADLKTFRSASLVSSILDTGGSTKFHPLDPSVELELESPDTPRRRGIYDSGHHSHMGRAASTRSLVDTRRGIQHKRFAYCPYSVMQLPPVHVYCYKPFPI